MEIGYPKWGTLSYTFNSIFMCSNEKKYIFKENISTFILRNNNMCIDVIKTYFSASKLRVLYWIGTKNVSWLLHTKAIRWFMFLGITLLYAGFIIRQFGDRKAHTLATSDHRCVIFLVQGFDIGNMMHTRWPKKQKNNNRICFYPNRQPRRL